MSESAAGCRLTLTLDARSLPLSSASSTLRALQAALRGVARGLPEYRALFDRQPQPILLLDAALAPDGELSFSIYFADPADDSPMRELSARAFAAFMSQFGDELKKTPQRGLWGRMSRRTPPPRAFMSESQRRLDDLRVEMRRLKKASLRCDRRAIEFDGERLEIL